jgi:peptide chain release factor 1
VPEEHEYRIDERDLDWKTCRGSGAGGQHRNVTDSAVQLTHRPSGLTVRCENERSQHQNRITALALLRARLGEAQATEQQSTRNEHRREQVGTGMRGDKRRTVALQRDQVHDHITDRKMSAKLYLRGKLEDLW